MKPAVRARLAAKFRAITSDRLEKLNSNFLTLESDIEDEKALELVLRELHSLKGESKMMGFHQIHGITHRVEELLHQVRRGEANLTQAASNVTLEAFDRIAGLAELDGDQDENAAAVDAFVLKVNALIDGEEEEEPAPEPEPEADDEVDDLDVDATVDFGAEGALDGVGEYDISDGDAPAPATAVETGGARRTSDEYLRVRQSQLDHVTEVAGEMLLMQSRFEETVAELRRLNDDWGQLLQEVQTARRADADPRQHLSSIERRGQDLSKQLRRLAARMADDNFDGRVHIEELERSVKDLRLFPISSLFGRFRRLVRDLAAEQGKDVRVILSGEGVQVDKQVLDLLEDPLMHLIRNCVDHGIEDPRRRVDTGKNPTATLRLLAAQIGSTLEITVSDDGRGVDPDRVRRSAVGKGLVSAPEAAELPDRDAIDLIFRSGFSTRTTVTELSGRGVGMSVVKENLEAAGGSVSVDSTVGEGTLFRLVAPISMVMSRVLLLEEQGGSYAIPMELVRTAITLPEDRVLAVGDARSFSFEDRRVPLVSLGPVLGGTSGAEPDEEGWSVVVVEHRGLVLGLVVEHFDGVVQAVHRPLDAFLAGLPLFQGAISLPGGRLALLLNIPEVLREAARGGRQATPSGRGSDEEVSRATRILVVDDSEFTRDMVVGLIRQLGYDVVDAVNGQQGLERFQETRPDLVFTDLDMPVLDGFGMLEKLRALPTGRTVPVIVFSTRGSAEDKRRAAELGADAYLVKTEFREEMLRTTVNRFLGGD